MPRIEWQDSYSTGNAQIDEQHREWFGLYNDMHERITKGDTEEYGGIALETLGKMQDYCRYHFEFEEDCMRKTNYAGIVEHRRAHRDFDTLVYQHYRDVSESGVFLNTEIMKLIENWILDHILVEDKIHGQSDSGMAEPSRES